MPSNHLILCRPLLLWPSIFPCIRVFSNESDFASDGQSIGASALPLPMNTWWLLGKLSFDIWTFVGKVMSLTFNTLSRWVIAFLPRSKRLSLSWLQSPSLVVLEPQKESLTKGPLFPHLFPMKWWDQMPWSWFAECWPWSQLFHSPISLWSRDFLVPLHFLP